LAEQLSESADHGTSGSRSVTRRSRRITFRGRYVCFWPAADRRHPAPTGCFAPRSGRSDRKKWDAQPSDRLRL